MFGVHGFFSVIALICCFYGLTEAFSEFSIVRFERKFYITEILVILVL